MRPHRTEGKTARGTPGASAGAGSCGSRPSSRTAGPRVERAARPRNAPPPAASGSPWCAGGRPCWRAEGTNVRNVNREWADRIAQRSARCDNCLVQRAHVLDVCAMTTGPDAAALMFDSFAARDERKRLTRRELVGTGSGVTEVSVALPTRLRAAGIFVQQRMTIDSQIGDHVSAFDTTSEVQEYVQLQFWCCGHRDCARVLVVGRDGCVNEQLLRVAETHVQELHGQNALERDDE